MLARYIFLSVIALFALAAATNFAPGDLERLAMLERDGRHEQTMGELQRRYDEGDRNPRMMLRLHNLKIRFGQVDEARVVLEEYARGRPADPEAQIGLIRFYQMNQLEGPYLTTLRTFQERSRSKELLNELLSFYRMTGRFRDEEDLLERTSRAAWAGPAELERLGLLAAARGDLQRAAAALRRADGRLDEQSRAARLGLFRVLVELKEPDEAHRRCVVWLRSWRNTELSVEFMDALSTAGRNDLALDIGNRFGGPGHDATLVSAELLHEQNKSGEALQRLREYQSAGFPEEPDRVQRFVAAAASVGGADMAIRAARLTGLRKLESNVIIDLIDAIQDGLENNASLLPRELLKGFSSEVEVRLQNVTPIGREATDPLVLPDELRLFVSHLALLDGDRDLARSFVV
jgi:tetratricopeptide (TPR) repeat protein